MSNSIAATVYPTPDTTPTTPRVQSVDPVLSQSIPINHLQRYFNKQGQKRHRKILRENLKPAVNKPTIRRLARRGGVKRIRSEIYQTVQEVVKTRIAEILGPAIALVEHKKQKTLTVLDVVYALKVIGNPIYGCGTIYHGDDIESRAGYMRNRRAAYAQNVRDTQKRLERERQDRLIDAQVRRLGGSVNLRQR